MKKGRHEEARLLLSSLNEANEFHLGYSSNESRGHGFGSHSAESVWGALTKSHASVSGLLKDLEDTALLIDGVGSDMISDAVCNILRGAFVKYTEDMCLYYGVPTTPDVDSGPIWDPVTESWTRNLVPLPVTDFGKVILVPKILVRQKIGYDAGEYYRQYILPELQNEHLTKGSSLVQVLADGQRRVYKKDLIEMYGQGKSAVVEQTKIRPHLLDYYRKDKASSGSDPLSFEQFSELEGAEVPDWDALYKELCDTPVGSKSAYIYEEVVEKILSALFYTSLFNPSKQHPLHNGRKRVDITYTNEAREGFFYWLGFHYPSQLIHVECKNYGAEIGNPEIDQLSGRFSPNRGKVGLLLCRKIADRQVLIKRCRDTSLDQRGFILALDDGDIGNLIEDRKTTGGQDFPYLRELFNSLL